MEKSSKRGKIPQRDWPSIIKRYEAGETLASIARTYDCSPPAISYIVSRTRAREINGEGSAEAPEPGIEAGEVPIADGVPDAQAHDAGRDELGEADPPTVPSLGTSQSSSAECEATDRAQGPAVAKSESDGSCSPAQGRNDAKPATVGTADGLAPTSSEQAGGHRRTLHLQFPQNTALPPGTEMHGGPGRHSAGPGSDTAAGSLADPPHGLARPIKVAPVVDSEIINNGWARKNNGPHTARATGAFIDQALRERVDGEITAFLAAFDAALAQDTLENRAGLREATDRLLRAGARTRIELERLEARVPLPPREAGAYAPPAWRPR